ncbi:ribonuclease Oy [Copidosoma floridanum]|uniref:ribonuclease Oy n=1 Tax=Copidosoma floridanum TaxID=29053 RepID=UPI0006C995D2|nr:ribonuclease Oy [Copidosoma floridanum]
MLIGLSVLLALLQLSSSSSPGKPRAGNYDFFIFTQVWPATSCFVWEEESPSHKCNMPPASAMDEWSIHGLWPTLNGTMGPFNCNSTLHFDIKALEKLRPELEVKWIDVHKGAKPHEFWRHEWEKHGTCSVDNEATNTEIKYFKKGLELLDEYEMKNVLAKANVTPNQAYLLQDFLDGVKKILGKNAFVDCVRNKKRKETYISELRICLDKTFRLIDCNGISDFPSNCNPKEKIIYPESVPDVLGLLPSVIQI